MTHNAHKQRDGHRKAQMFNSEITRISEKKEEF